MGVARVRGAGEGYGERAMIYFLEIPAQSWKIILNWISPFFFWNKAGS